MADKVLKPARLALSPDSPTATSEYEHWLHTFENFASALSLPPSYSARVTGNVTREMMEDKLKLDALTNLISHEIWTDIKDCQTYDAAKKTMNDIFIKQPRVYARFKLASTKQTPGQTLESYRRVLDKLSRDCHFTDVSASKYREDMVLQAFIAGLSSNDIRQRLLEEKQLDFDSAFKLAVSRYDSHKEAGMYKRAGRVSATKRRSVAIT